MYLGPHCTKLKRPLIRHTYMNKWFQWAILFRSLTLFQAKLELYIPLVRWPNKKLSWSKKGHFSIEAVWNRLIFSNKANCYWYSLMHWLLHFLCLREVKKLNWKELPNFRYKISPLSPFPPTPPLSFFFFFFKPFELQGWMKMTNNTVYVPLIFMFDNQLSGWKWCCRPRTAEATGGCR